MEHRARDLARQFWAKARLPETYPRDIEHAVALVIPVAIVKLPTLTTSEVLLWLARHHVVADMDTRRADLMGCLVANRGNGIAFVCGADTSDEQRLTIAHEAAHFIRHYLIPRELVIGAMGDAIMPVLDGDRAATTEERVAGVLAGVRVGAHVHLLSREQVDARVAGAEDDADDLGLEMLAPREVAIAFLGTRHVEQLGPVEQQRALSLRFGVPAPAFAGIVADHNRPRPTAFVADVMSILRERR
jgi:hypothetical protein